MFLSWKTVHFALIAAIAVNADHVFTLKNNCGSNIQPVVANVNCGYSPRCDKPSSGGVPNPAIPHYGPQPHNLAPGTSQNLTINRQWNGRIFVQNGHCGDDGEGCTMAEFNLDTGNHYTPQAYDISNVQGFTQSIEIAVNGGETVTCTEAGCGCRSAYPPGDMSGCGNDSPVRASTAGDRAWTITFCP